MKNYSEGVAGIIDVKLTSDAGAFVLNGRHQGSTTLLLIKNDPRYNEQWPRPLVPYRSTCSSQCSSFSIISEYASGSSNSSISSARLSGLTTKIQPSPNASSLIVSGLSGSASLIATISPDTGE